MKNLFLSCIMALMAVQAYAQVSFTSSSTNGCAPLSVAFTNTSTTGTTYVWDYGMGGPGDTSLHGSFTFNQVGQYNVVLFGYDNSMSMVGYYNETIYVNGSGLQVYHNPEQCPQSPVNFSLGGGPFSGPAFWDFGDGFTTTGGGQYMNHEYQDTGYYTITVSLDGICGPETLTSNIQISNNVPVQIFGLDFPGSSICPNDEFNVGIYTPGDASVNWNFGDGRVETNGSSYETHQYSATGYYTITAVVSNSCGMDSTVYMNIVVENNVTPDLTSFGMSPQEACPGQPIDFYANDFSEYAWDLGDGTTSTSNYVSHVYAAAGNYVVTLSVTNGCGNTAAISENVTISNSLEIDYLSVNTQGSSSVCPGDEVRFYASDNMASYEWNFGDGVNQTSTNNNVTHSFASTGTFVVSLKGISFCGKDSTVSLTITVSDSIPVVMPPVEFDPSASCPGQSFYVSASGNGSANTYLYDFGSGFQTSPTHSFNTIGVYPIKVKATNGCGFSVEETFNYTVSDSVIPYSPEFFPLGNSFCPGDFVQIVAFSNDSLSFDFGDGSAAMSFPMTIIDGDPYLIANHAYADTGVYNVVITAYNKCGLSNSDSATISVGLGNTPEVEIDVFSNNNMVDSVVTFLAFGADSLLVNFGDGSATIQVSPIVEFYHTYTSTGSYTVTLTGYNGCGLSNTNSLSLNISGPVGKPEILRKATAFVYPNPFNSIVTIESEDVSVVEIFDLTGKRMNVSSVISNNKATINGSILNNGMYIIRVVTPAGIVIKKLLKN